MESGCKRSGIELKRKRVCKRVRIMGGRVQTREAGTRRKMMNVKEEKCIYY